jgi:hypothetical protein
MDDLLDLMRVRGHCDSALDSSRRRPTDHILRDRDDHDVHPVCPTPLLGCRTSN